MWERVQHSIIGHNNLAHIAIYVKSGPLRVLMGAVVKLSRHGKRVTLHNTYEEAEGHLLNLLNSAPT